jgi:hypothetical protein
VPGAYEFRVGRTQSHRQWKRRDRLEWQRVEFRVSGFAVGDVLQGMRMIVDRLDLHDIGEQIAIDSGLSVHV